VAAGPQHSLWYALHNSVLAALAVLGWHAWEANQRAVFTATRR
jgi:hypothetical protein